MKLTLDQEVSDAAMLRQHQVKVSLKSLYLTLIFFGLFLSFTLHIFLHACSLRPPPPISGLALRPHPPLPHSSSVTAAFVLIFFLSDFIRQQLLFQFEVIKPLRPTER